MRHLIALILVVINCALAASLALKWVDHKTFQPRQAYWSEPAPVLPSKDSMGVASVKLAALDASAFAVTTLRPLFFNTRKPPAPLPPPVVPPAPPPPPPPPPPDPLASLELYGLISLGDGKGGVIAKVNGSMRQVKFGEQFGDLTLKDVVGREAVFAAPDGAERRIAMNYRSLQQLVPGGAVSGKPAELPAQAANNAPPAPYNYEQEVLDRRARINKARANAGLKPFESW